MLNHVKYSHIWWLILLVLIGSGFVILRGSLLLLSRILWLQLSLNVASLYLLVVLASLHSILSMWLSGSDSDNLKSVLAILTFCTTSIIIIPLQILHQVILDLPSKVPEAILGATILVGTSPTLSSSISHGTSQDCLS
jgi:glucose dehydrogenase